MIFRFPLSDLKVILSESDFSDFWSSSSAIKTMFERAKQMRIPAMIKSTTPAKFFRIFLEVSEESDVGGPFIFHSLLFLTHLFLNEWIERCVEYYYGYSKVESRRKQSN